jgi:hypothetical protein
MKNNKSGGGIPCLRREGAWGSPQPTHDDERATSDQGGVAVCGSGESREGGSPMGGTDGGDGVDPWGDPCPTPRRRWPPARPGGVSRARCGGREASKRKRGRAKELESGSLPVSMVWQAQPHQRVSSQLTGHGGRLAAPLWPAW